MVRRSAIALTSAVRWEMKMTQPALPRQLARELEQPVRLAGRQRRRRLVEDQDARILGQALGDLDDLPLGECQAAAAPGPGRNRGKA